MFIKIKQVNSGLSSLYEKWETEQEGDHNQHSVFGLMHPFRYDQHLTKQLASTQSLEFAMLAIPSLLLGCPISKSEPCL
jgi:hypothetical protein